jgi:hypothetical protein
MASSLGADLCMLLLHRERKTGEQSYRYHCVFSFFFSVLVYHLMDY